MSSAEQSWIFGHRWIILLTPLLLLTLYFLFPFLDGIILGTVFAYVGRPISGLFPSRRHLGALIATICIVVPVFVVLGIGAVEIFNFFLWTARNQDHIITTILALAPDFKIPQMAYDLIAGSLSNVLEMVMPILASLPVINLGRAISLGIMNFLISIPVCYFLLLDGRQTVDSVLTMLPGDMLEAAMKYLARIDLILSGIFLGSIYTSIVGSVIAAALFYAFGLPRPFALASFVFIAGMVPLLTAWLVIVPITIYRYFAIGPPEALIFFALAASLIYLPSELLIRPYLVSYKSSIHPLLVMLSFLGGALVAGMGGFFLAPAVVGIIVGIYQVRREERMSSQVEDS